MTQQKPFDALYLIKPSCLLFFMVFSACSNKHLNSSICNNQEFITKHFSHSTFAQRKKGTLLFFTTYRSNCSNEFILELKNQQYSLLRDSLEYVPDAVTPANVCNYVASLQRELDSLQIREYIGEPDGLGTRMVLYMEDGSMIFQTEEVTRITYYRTLKNISQARYLCNNWYLGRY
ncbi:hypothetical protein D3Y59_06380 [Hymenobacter oligotrophus]|uniref:Lipoprotein n=1 Tax=Hymenobacter oligotrophus TaxID=2319843 RepID=A0A3B7QZT7_9BACT|nr:hypothetical protein [Hymenobacter oligotrophus]AYA36713.1 hypothetical protein D3Y59_06380 [Hymenobacter oligotrophus]